MRDNLYTEQMLQINTTTDLMNSQMFLFRILSEWNLQMSLSPDLTNAPVIFGRYFAQDLVCSSESDRTQVLLVACAVVMNGLVFLFSALRADRRVTSTSPTGRSQIETSRRPTRMHV